MQCGKEITNERRKDSTKFMPARRFKDVKFCSIRCSKASRFIPNKYRIIKDKVYLFLENKNVECLIDLVDFENVRNIRWGLDSIGYPIGTKNGIKIRLHNYLMGRKEGLEIDHINRNKLNNQRSNLRFVTHRENIMNSPRGDAANRKCIVKTCVSKHWVHGFCKKHHNIKRRIKRTRLKIKILKDTVDSLISMLPKGTLVI